MDRIIEKPEGFYASVNGQLFGAWRSKGEAQAGMATEQHRAKERAAAETARQLAALETILVDYAPVFRDLAKR